MGKKAKVAKKAKKVAKKAKKIAKKVKIAVKKGKKAAKKGKKVVKKAVKPIKKVHVKKVTKKVGNNMNTTVFHITEIVTVIEVPIVEIITVQTTRLAKVRAIIKDTAKRIKKAKGKKVVKLQKKLT